MEVSITATKHQTLASSLPLSPAQFHFPVSIRREFLGCGTHFRPPAGVRSRKNSIKKLGFRFRPPKCFFSSNSLMDHNSVVVVAAAVATIATIQLIYLDYNRRRRDALTFADERQSDVTVSSGFCKQNEDILETGTVGSQLLSSEGVRRSSLERENAFEETPQNMCHKGVHNSHINDLNLVELQTDFSFGEILNSQTRLDDELLKANEFEGLTSSVEDNDVNPVEGDDFADKIPCFLSDVGDGIAIHLTPNVVNEPGLSCSVINTEKQMSNINRIEYELQDTVTKHSEDLISSNSAYLGVSADEIDHLNEEKQLVVRCTPYTRRLSTEPCHLTSQNNTLNHHRHQLRTALENAHVLMKSSPIAEGRTLIGCLKEGPMNHENNIIKVDGFTRGIGRTLMPKNSTGDFSGSPKQNGVARDVYGPTSYLRTYNHLIGDGRLRDCINLLERIRRKGLLDMDKVHHTKFLKACKNKKAVKEAIQFCKLIQKPTLSTFNMLLSVCASSQDFDGAFQVMLLVKEAGLKPDCKLYTTLISTCAKSGKVDAMFEVFHEMVNAGVEPNVNTYGALIDGCARAGQVAKAFGAYGIMRSKKVQPDRVIFNALITACGQSGAVDRAFDVLAEMRTEPKPIDPDHVTIGALMKTCTQAGQVDRVREVYKMIHIYNIRGTPDVYTIAVKSCSQTGDLEFALIIYNDMKMNGVVADEMFLSTIMDVAGHAQKIDTAFEILQDAKNNGIQLGSVSYSSLMGACCNAKNWQKALELYEEIKAIKLHPTVSTLNALITSLCDGDQLMKSVEVLDEIKNAGVQPNIITYSILIVACEKKDDAELGFMLLSKAKKDGILPNLIMCRCLTGLCLKSLEKAYSLGEPIVTFNSGKPQIDSKWASFAIMVYRETISAGVIPTIEVFSQVLGCLQFPRDASLRNRFVENLGVTIDASRWSDICSLLDGFGEYDTRSFSVLEEAVSLGVIPRVSFKDSPIVVDARKLLIHTVEVYLLTILKGLKHRLAAGARLPNVTILLPIEKTQVEFANKERTVNVAGRIGQAVGSLLRRLGIPFSGDESYGKIRINGLSLRRWFKPRVSSVLGRPGDMIPAPMRLAKGISDQQRTIRNINNLS